MNKIAIITILTILGLCTAYAQPQKATTVQVSGKSEYLKGNAANKVNNYQEAFKWYTLSAEKGYANAMYSLGYIYENGEGMDPNIGEAMKWYQKASQKGNTDALVALGVIYLNGDQYEEAENCLKIAAEKENTGGMDMLGYFYFTRERYKEALPWLKKAAEKELPTALYHLGEMYENGYEVEENTEKAIAYYKRAAAQGEQNAIKKLKNQ